MTTPKPSYDWAAWRRAFVMVVRSIPWYNHRGKASIEEDQ